MEAEELFSFIKPTTVKANRKLRFQQATIGLKINLPPKDINLLFWFEMVVEKILEHFRRVCKPTSHDKIGLIIERVDYPSIPIWTYFFICHINTFTMIIIYKSSCCGI